MAPNTTQGKAVGRKTVGQVRGGECGEGYKQRFIGSLRVTTLVLVRWDINRGSDKDCGKGNKSWLESQV